MIIIIILSFDAVFVVSLINILNSSDPKIKPGVMPHVTSAEHIAAIC